MYLKTQKFLVLGISRSGYAAARLLLSHGAKVFVYDDNANSVVEKNVNSLKSMGASVCDRDSLSAAVTDADVLLLSPGVPVDHPIAVQFKKSGKRIMGELELGVLFLKATSVGVTGTNGKTTTVGLIKDLLSRAGKKTIACGNIGKPLSECAEELGYDDIAVVEVSSFQLETLSSFRPHVYVELNVTEDHLNRHYNMTNYIFLKEKMLKNATEDDFAVLNYDDLIVREFGEHTKAKVLYFSTQEKVNGAYALDGTVYLFDRPIMREADIPIAGKHNLSNVLAALLAAYAFGVDGEIAAEGVRRFKGVHHRIEKIAEVDGVTYINDSKATNVDATIKALDCMKGYIVLLLGGKDKGYDYDGLFSVVKQKNVLSTVLYGENRYKLLSSAMRQGFDPVTLVPDFKQAVAVARLLAKRDQTVLLSPASASFDEFSGYEERGERFFELVSSFQNKVEKITDEELPE